MATYITYDENFEQWKERMSQWEKRFFVSARPVARRNGKLVWAYMCYIEYRGVEFMNFGHGVHDVIEAEYRLPGSKESVRACLNTFRRSTF